MDDPSYFGTTTFDEPETIEISSRYNRQQTITVSRARGCWRPPERLASYLPDDFSLRIDCYVTSDQLRRFLVRCNLDELIDIGAVVGLAVIHGIQGFNKEIDYTYRMMHLVFRHVRGRAHRGRRGMKEHVTREFKYSRDLYARPAGRVAGSEWDILPDTIGLTPQGEGHRWSITELTRRGREAAVVAGYQNPTSKHAIHFGLFEAARLNPLHIAHDEVPALVRLALFDIDSPEANPSANVLETVTERLFDAIYRNLGKDTAQFDRWFLGPSNSLVKQIAQQKSDPGGKLDRQEVRSALLHLGWKAYEYVGQCLHAFMRTVKNSIPDPLTEEERHIYEHMYESQPYYGNMPLAILAERMGFLRQAILKIWEEPQDENHVRVLHGLLQYYADMAAKRRDVDRRSKRAHRVDENLSPENTCVDETPCVSIGDLEPLDLPSDGALIGPEDDASDAAPRTAPGIPGQFIDNLHSSAAPVAGPFQEVAEHIRELNGIECNNRCTVWEAERQDESEEWVTLSFRCECGEVAKDVRMSMDQFEQRAREILD